MIKNAIIRYSTFISEYNRPWEAFANATYQPWSLNDQKQKLQLKLLGEGTLDRIATIDAHELIRLVSRRQEGSTFFVVSRNIWIEITSSNGFSLSVISFV